MGKNPTNFVRYTQMGKNDLKSAIFGNYWRQRLKSTLIEFFNRIFFQMGIQKGA